MFFPTTANFDPSNSLFELICSYSCVVFANLFAEGFVGLLENRDLVLLILIPLAVSITSPLIDARLALSLINSGLLVLSWLVLDMSLLELTSVILLLFLDGTF